MKNLLTLTLLVLTYAGFGQQTITKWTFDASTLQPDSGTGHIAFKGGAQFTAFVQGNPTTGSAFNTNSYPAQSTNNLSAGVRFKIPSTGFKDLSFRFEQRNSATASKKTVIFVSADSINFTKVDSLLFTAANTFLTKTLDLSSFTNLNNKSQIYILLVSGFVGTAYAPTTSTSNYGTTGTWRFDNIRLSGTPITNVKPTLNLTSNKTSLSEALSDTASIIFTLTDTVAVKLKSKVDFTGTGITAGDFAWVGRDSFIINRNKLADTLRLRILDDAAAESLETGVFSIVNLDSNAVLGTVPNISLISDDVVITPISNVQGSGNSSGMVNSIVTVEGIVTEDLQGTNEQNGFYLQDVNPDSDPATSEGIFVSNTSFSVALGDRVKVTGKVVESFGQTSLSTVSAVTLVSQNNTVSPTDVTFPVSSSTYLERFEGMKIRVVQNLTVTENFTLGRFGEITASVNGRLFNPTNSTDPNDSPASGNSSSGTSNVSNVAALQDLNNRSKILICDKLSIQNPNPIPFIDPVNKTLRSGTTIDTLIGVLGYDFSLYRVYPAAGNPKFHYAARPSVPAITGANLKVAGTNVLNFFNGDGMGGGFPTARGAENMTEFLRQEAKIVALIQSLDADVLGLMEMENDGDSTYSAIRELVTAINTAYGSNVYNYVRDSKGTNGNPGSDAIKVALIYKTVVLTPVGSIQEL